MKLIQNSQQNFPEMKGGSSPFGTFPKIIRFDVAIRPLVSLSPLIPRFLVMPSTSDDVANQTSGTGHGELTNSQCLNV